MPRLSRTSTKNSGRVWTGKFVEIGTTISTVRTADLKFVLIYRDLPVMQVKQFPHGEFSDYVDLCVEPLSSLIEPMVQAVREGFLREKYGTEKQPAVDETIEMNLSGLRNYELRYLAESGFRKADDVRKETAREIADFLKSIDFNLLPNVILEKYGVETDKCEITD